MTGLPTVGAHAAILGVAAFEGNVRQILYAMDQLNNRTTRMAQQADRDWAAAAKATERSAQLTAAAAEAETKAIAAAADAQAAAVKASVDRQIADEARLQAAFAQVATFGAAQQVVSPKGSPARAAEQGNLANANLLASASVANANALEKEAAASEKAAASAAAHAETVAASSARAQAALASYESTAVGAASSTGAAFTAMGAASTVAMFAVIAAVTLGIAAIVGLSVASIKMGADYSQQMNTIQTFTEATNGQMSALNQTIVGIGTTSQTSMGDAAKAAADLALNGVSVQQSLDGALKSTVDLSNASGGLLKLDDAARAIAIGITAFNLTGTESVRVANAITGAAQTTTATYNDFAMSLKQVASVANSLHFSIEDTTAAIGLLSQSAIRGSDAGTSLRTMFQHLEKPSKKAQEVLKDFNVSLYDANGAVRPLRDVIINLEKAFGDQAVATGKVTEAQRNHALATLFEADGQRAALALINQGVKGYDDLIGAQQRLTASDVAGKLLLPLNAQLGLLANNLGAASTQFGGAFEPALQKVVGGLIAAVQPLAQDTQYLTSFGNAVSALVTGNGFDALYTQLTNVFGADLGNKLIEFVNLFRNIGDAIGTYIGPALADLGQAIQTAFPSASVDQFAGAMANAAQAIRIVAATIGGIIEIAAQLIGLIGQLPDAVKLVGAAFLIGLTPVGPVLGSIIAILAIMPQAVLGVLDALIQLPSITQVIGDGFSAWGTIAQTAISIIGRGFSALGSAIQPIWQSITDGFGRVISAVTPFAAILALPLIAIYALVSAAPAFAQAVGSAVEAAGNAFSQLGTTIANIVKGFGDSFSAIGDEFAVVPAAAENTVQATNNVFIEGFGAVVSAVGGIFSGLGSVVEGALGTVGQTIQSVVGGFGDSFSSMGTEINALWTLLWSSVVTTLNNAANLIAMAANAVGTFLSSLFSTIANVVIGLWNGLWTQVVSLFNSFVKTITTNVATFTSSMAASFASAGNSIGNVWASIWNGLVSVLTRALNALAERLNGFFAALKASPVGQFVEGVGEGFAQFGETINNTFEQVGVTVDTTQRNIQDKLQELKDGLTSIQSPFEGINFAAQSAGAGTENSLGRMRSAAESTQPAMQDFGDGAKKAAKDAEEAFKRLNEMFQDTMRQLENLETDTMNKILTAQQNHDDKYNTEIQHAAEKIVDIYNKRDEDIAQNERDFNTKVIRGAIRFGLQQQIEDNRTARQRQYEDDDTAYSRALDQTRRARQEIIDEKERAYSQELEDQNRAADRAYEADERAIKRRNDAIQEGLREAEQMQSRAMSQMFEAQDAALSAQRGAEDEARSRAREQSKLAQQHQRDLAKAMDPQERLRVEEQYQQQLAELNQRASEQAQDQAIQNARKQQDMAIKAGQQAAQDSLKRSQQSEQKALQYQQEDEDVKRQQKKQDDDTARQRAQATQVRDFKKGLDDQERKDRYAEEDADLKRRRERENSERDIKRAEDFKLRDLENSWELQDHLNKLQNISDKAQAEVDKTNETLGDRLAALDAELVKELAAIESTYEKAKRAIIQKWEDAWDELIAKSPAVEKQLNVLFNTFMDAVTNTDTLVKNLITDLTNAITLQGQLTGTTPPPPPPPPLPATEEPTPQQPSGQTGAKTQAGEGTYGNNGGNGGEGEGLQHGGIVPGPYGKPTLVMAHGGEPYLGLQNAEAARYLPIAQAIASISNRAAVMAPPLQPSTVSSNVTYQLNANYSQYQSPASAEMDLQAMVAMTRR